MRVKQANCPECGGAVVFSQANSALSVCSYCRSVVARTDVDVEKIGKVGLLAEVPSLLRIGARGTGFGGFTVAGRLQLDHGAGTWNEWYLGLDSGKWLWLAEAQGRYYLTAPSADATQVPSHRGLRLGHSVTVPNLDGSPLTMHVVEIHKAQIVSAEGELPFRISPSEPVFYADLSGPRRSFGTLDYGENPDGSAKFYVGHQVEPAGLGLVSGGFETRPETKPSAKAARMECPSCHGALELRAPDHTLRVTCPYCATLVDVSKEPLKALRTAKREDVLKPRFPLGAKGSLRGTEYQVIGHLRRTIDKSAVYWDEYLLAVGPSAAGGFHYLIESGGHFTLARPVALGDVTKTSAKERSFDGKIFRHAETAVVKVSHVNGEFPWEVEVGETVKAEDYWVDGAMLSFETSLGPQAELNVSIGDYIGPHEALAAFGVKDGPPSQTYVAPHQPNPHRANLRQKKRLAWLSIALLVGMMVLAAMRASGRQTQQSFVLNTVAGAEPSAEHIFLSEPFQLGKSGLGAASIELSALGLSNSWIDADLALINDEDGVARQFGLGVSYYSGYADGEFWSEGSVRASATLPAVPAGRYVLRVEPSWPTVRECTSGTDCGILGLCEAGQCRRACGESLGRSIGCPGSEQCVGSRCVLASIPYRITVSHGESRVGWGFLFALLIALVPLLSWIRSGAFEQRRLADMEA